MPSRMLPGRNGTNAFGRRTMLAGALLLAALIALATGWLLWPTSGLKAANFSRVKAGMTRAEVERLLGGPPGDFGRYHDGTIDFGDGAVLQVFAVPGAVDARPETWTDDRNHFYFFFDREGHVVAGSKQSRYHRSPKGWSLRDIAFRLGAMLF